MSTSNRLKDATDRAAGSALPSSSPAAGSAPSSSPAAGPPAVPPTATGAVPVATLVRLVLARTVARDASVAMMTLGQDAPQTYVMVSGLMNDIKAKDWYAVAADLELLIAALDVTTTPDDRSALATALMDRMTTAALLDPGPPK